MPPAESVSDLIILLEYCLSVTVSFQIQQVSFKWCRRAKRVDGSISHLGISQTTELKKKNKTVHVGARTGRQWNRPEGSLTDSCIFKN